MMPIITTPELDFTEIRLKQKGVNICRFNEILEAAKKKDPSITAAFVMHYLDHNKPADPDIIIGYRKLIRLDDTIDMVHSYFVQDQRIPNTKCPAPMNMRRMT